MFEASVQYMMAKLYLASSSAHYTCFLFRTFIMVKYSKFLWSVNTLICIATPNRYTLHYFRHSTIASISLLYILYYSLALINFLL